MAQDAPTVVVLAGPNGAGKTTSARTLLAETLQLMTFVNADVIAQGLSGFNPESMGIEAGRVMLQRLHALAEQQTSFAFETTLAGRSHGRWLRSLGKSGYRIYLVYLWLASADLAVGRVAERVRTGGHAIPEDTIRQRYERSLDNLFKIYRPLANVWEVYDNSASGFTRLIARGDQAGSSLVLVQEVWDEIQKGRT